MKLVSPSFAQIIATGFGGFHPEAEDVIEVPSRETVLSFSPANSPPYNMG